MKVSVRFSLVSRDSSDYPIRMRISYMSFRLDVRTGFVCPPSRWDSVKMRVSPGTTNRYGENASLINAKLAEYEATINKLLMAHELTGEDVPVPARLKTEFEEVIGRIPHGTGEKTSIGNLFQSFIREASKNRCWSFSTVNGYEFMLRQLESLPVVKMPISELTPQSLAGISQLFITRGLKNSSIKCLMERFNNFLNWAKEKNLYKGDLYKASLKGTATDRTISYLEWPEVMLFKEAPLTRQSHKVARDTFCFQCFTGLRTIDVEKLTWSQVHLSAPVPHIIVTTLKTADNIRIELNHHAVDIINRYIDRAGACATVFPPLSTCTKNLHLRYIAGLIGIKGSILRTSYNGASRKDEQVARKDAITSHWGRHSFIVHALSIGIPPNVVMQWTGHSNYDAMKPYINIADCTRIENMALFDRQ